jgi:CPA2 family monovalent cation:H+ antiporter-2
MHDVHAFLQSLTIVLGVAALTTVLFQRLKQPVVLGYILAGLIVGPHVPVPLIADRGIVQTLSELGVILLMFSLGLEFSVGKFVRVIPTAGFAAIFQSSVMLWLGFLTGRLFGWTNLESIFLGTVIAISSTTIIAKAFEEQGITGHLRTLVVGILLIEDLIAILLMALLTALATGAGLSAGALATTVGRLAAFLIVLLAVGFLVIPRFVRFVVAINRAETTLVATIGICFGMAYIAQTFGYSVALGAFLAGSLVSESGHAEAIERLVQPVRDLFAAIFFVSVGLLIDPRMIAAHWDIVLVLTITVILGKILSVSFGAFLTGNGTQTSVRAGMSLAQIGEFSFIIASLGVALGATRELLYHAAVAVSAITTLTTPWLIRAAEPAAVFIDRKLPLPLQTFASLYGTWFERLQAGSVGRKPTGARYWMGYILLDVALLTGLIVGVGLDLDLFVRTVVRTTGMGPTAARILVISGAFALSLPLLLGLGRLARRLGETLAERALPHRAGKVDMDAAPRRALVVTLQLGVALLAVIIILAVTQQFLPTYSGPLILAILVVGFAIAIWRDTRDLQGHVRAGSQAVVEALSRYGQAGSGDVRSGDAALDDVNRLLPGLGAPVAIRIQEQSPSANKTLAQLNLRGRTGATVLAISRDGDQILVPPANERLRAGDLLALAGTQEAIAAARIAILGTTAAPATPAQTPFATPSPSPPQSDASSG